MNITSHIKSGSQNLLMLLLAASLVLSACGGGEANPPQNQTTPDNTPNIRMDIPASLTGETVDSNSNTNTGMAFAAAVSEGTGQPCAYTGGNEQDPFRNGYSITKILVSAVAAWSCIADLVIDVSNFIDHNGDIHATDNDRSSPSYDPEDPTHYSVTDDSDSQTTVRLYYGYYRDNPPQQGENPQFYVSWNEAGDDVLEGRIIVDARNMNQPNRNPEDPIMMRMDFLYTQAQKEADMFLRFDEGNQWAEGFRIHLVRDMYANPLQKVYVARGRIDMKNQFIPVEGISEIPDVHFYTVANRAGDGAAIADFVNVSVPLQISGGIIDNHLGNYLFSKNDTYYFDNHGNADWVFKTVSSAEYRGGRNTPATGGTWIPLDPSLDMIINELALDVDYFTGSKCGDINSDCTQLLNAVFSHSEDFGGQEHNQGSEPVDWRSEAISNPIPLESIYPNGTDWTGAFLFEFTPQY